MSDQRNKKHIPVEYKESKPVEIPVRNLNRKEGETHNEWLLRTLNPKGKSH